MAMNGNRRAVFLDKDGTLIEDVPYNVDPEYIRLLPGVLEGLRALHEAGYLLIVVSNQSGVARGYFPESALVAVEERIRALLAAGGVPLAGFYYCPHHPDGVVPEYALSCLCRKPSHGLVVRASREHGIDRTASWFVGDILDDIEAGHRAGCRTVLVDNGGETLWELSPLRTPDCKVASLREAAEQILASPDLLPSAHPGDVGREGAGGVSQPPNRGYERPESSLARADEGGEARVDAPAEGDGMAEHLHGLLNRFVGARVLVIGEAMLDSYLTGSTDRLCREAPVPVVALGERRDMPGGAANVAANVASLGGEVTFLSVTGDDAEGRRLREALEARGVQTDMLLCDEGRRTLAKQRVVAASQVLVRLDQGDTDPVTDPVERALIDCLREHYTRADALIVSDYAYGILTPQVIATLAELQERHRRPLIVDAKDLRAYRHLHVTAIKPSYAEAVRLLGLPPLERSGSRAEQIIAQTDRLLEVTGAQIAAVTLDVDGAVILEHECSAYRISARPGAQARSIGAGDTFVGALALALARGADGCAAAEIAAAAAAVVMEADGTTTCTAEELRERIAGPVKEWVKVRDLVARLARERAQGKRIVFTNGCFDILHRGHVTLLNRARALGDVLVVGVNTDESVARLKGPHRPINSVADRMEVLAALHSVDHVIAFGEDTPERLIRAIAPDIFVKGGDYTPETLPEAALVESLGGVVRILPFLPDRSTTRVIERIRSNSSDHVMPATIRSEPLHTDYEVVSGEE